MLRAPEENQRASALPPAQGHPHPRRTSLEPSSASAVDLGVYFLDTSTLIKRYVPEIGTAWV
jgi:hypothetical protein